MDQGPLVREEIDAGAELVRRFDRYAPVRAAFWAKRSGDDEFRYLYIASDRIDDTNFDLGYAEVLRIGREMRNPDLNVFRVKLIAGNHPLAKAAAELADRFPAVAGTRHGFTRLGNTMADDLYIYPPLVPAPAA